MKGLKIGHFTDTKAGTGISVFLFENSAVGAYWVCGSAPATHELDVLDAENSVPHLHGLVLSGGSAYGLFTARGVMDYLTERGIGHPILHGVVPIVPAAAIYDLSYKQALSPTAEQAYQACLSAKEDNSESGRIGAGAGATIGKIIPHAKSMSGGLGYAQLELANGLQVAAYAVVNTIGDVRNAAGEIIAGACDEQGSFADCQQYLLSGKAESELFTSMNTTLVMVATNAKLAKDELKRVGKMAVAGMARAISVAFTRFDGDMIFCVSVGDHDAGELTVGALAAEAVRLAIMDAVKDSEII
jgi:L-aminopeptidase/D-esterase-like protein